MIGDIYVSFRAVFNSGFSGVGLRATGPSPKHNAHFLLFFFLSHITVHTNDNFTIVDVFCIQTSTSVRHHRVRMAARGETRRVVSGYTCDCVDGAEGARCQN